MDEYEIGYTHARDLHLLAASELEHAAIERLADFRGSAADVALVAAIYDRAGERANAAELLRILPRRP